MTGIFSSEVRSCSEEVLAAAVGGSGLLSVAAVAGDDAAAAGLPFGLAFSVAEGSVCLMVGGETTGAGMGLVVWSETDEHATCTYLLLLWPRPLLRPS